MGNLITQARRTILMFPAPSQSENEVADSPGSEPLTVSNAEKLALTGIEVGQVVHVTDATLVSGAGSPEVNGVYTSRGIDGNAFRFFYNLVGAPDNQLVSSIAWNPDGGGKWEMLKADALAYSAPDDVEFPWLAAIWFVERDGSDPPPTVSQPPLVQHYTGGDPSDEANWSL